MSRELRALSLSKHYGRGHPVFSEVSFALEPGTVTEIIGSNGSGKSTLMRILAGVSAPSSGRVAGRDGSIGMVPERFVPPGNLTATSYLAHMGRLRGLERGQSETMASELVERLALAPGPRVAMKTLSKGNAQKVAIAQAFLAPVSLLILDEPRTGLDPTANTVLDELVDAARQQGTIVLLSGHEVISTERVDQRLQLAGGTLSVLAASAVTLPETIIRLVATATATPIAGLVETDERTALLRVLSTEVDAALSSVLNHGWSVIEVRAAQIRQRDDA